MDRGAGAFARGFVLVAAMLLAGTAFASGAFVQDPTGDEHVTADGLPVPSAANCHDRSVDITNASFQADQGVLTITVAVADAHGLPSCGPAGVDQLSRYSAGITAGLDPDSADALGVMVYAHLHAADYDTCTLLVRNNETVDALACATLPLANVMQWTVPISGAGPTIGAYDLSGHHYASEVLTSSISRTAPILQIGPTFIEDDAGPIPLDL